MSEMVGVPKDELILLLQVALFGVELAPSKKAQHLDLLKRLSPKPNKAVTFPPPTGTAEKIDITKTLDQASSIGASPSWTVSHGA